MKRFLILFLMLAGFTSGAQNPEILKGASTLYDSNYNMDFEPIAEITYPKVVEQVGGREKFLAKLDNDYQNEKFRKRLQLTSPVFQVGPEKTIGGKSFCVVSFRNPTRYFYEDKLDTDAMAKEVANWKNIAATKEVYGEPNRNSINVKRVSFIVAVKDETTGGNWKFFNLDDLDQLAVFDNVISAETKKQLGL
ncbi:MAG: hypothetical protein EOO50_06950 [Flavobacterium sp.]|uniref:hypothetical protein n=1 Tax=Flavobacterium sp. TaxID=239 RepID=UPI0012220BF9|nr:hypothetical protein [Flavobacterium sp.]RZJ66996.1 MAG: hypothetical protein EOO50_06950 [Flavobacterium sp.]